MEALEDKIQKLEQRVELLEGKKGTTPTVKASDFKSKGQLTLEKWKHSYISDDFSSYYKISYELFNGFDKAIKLIDTSLRLEDLLGENIYGIKINPDIKISPNGKVQDSGSYRINQSISNQHRMKDMDPKDVVVELNIRK